MSEPFTVNLGALAAYEDKLRDQAVTIAELKTRNENIHTAKELLVADVSRLSAEVERLKADNQRYAHAVAEQGEIETELRQDVRRLEGERDGDRRVLAELRTLRAASDRLIAAYEESRVATEGEQDGPREALANLRDWAWNAAAQALLNSAEAMSNGEDRTYTAQRAKRDAFIEVAGLIARALSTPTGTRAGTAAAAENQKAVPPGKCNACWRKFPGFCPVHAVAVPPVKGEDAP